MHQLAFEATVFTVICLFSEDDAQPFYDETLWHMRDKSKDYNAFYPEDSYYGVKGVKRMSNRVGLIGCAIIMVIGMTGFYVALRFVLAPLRGATHSNDQQAFLIGMKNNPCKDLV